MIYNRLVTSQSPPKQLPLIVIPVSTVQFQFDSEDGMMAFGSAFPEKEQLGQPRLEAVWFFGQLWCGHIPLHSCQICSKELGSANLHMTHVKSSIQYKANNGNRWHFDRKKCAD